MKSLYFLSSIMILLLGGCTPLEDEPENPIFPGKEKISIYSPAYNTGFDFESGEFHVGIPGDAATVFLLIFPDTADPDDIDVQVSNGTIENLDDCVAGIRTGINSYNNSEYIQASILKTANGSNNPSTFDFTAADATFLTGAYLWFVYALDSDGNMVWSSPRWNNSQN